MRNTNALPPFEEYTDLPGLLDGVNQAFHTVDAVRWFVRRHRHDLASSGAIIIVTGRMRFHPERFKEAVVRIGQRAAA